MAWAVIFLFFINTSIWKNHVERYFNTLSPLITLIFGTASDANAAFLWLVITFIIALISLHLTRRHRHMLIFSVFILIIILAVLGIREIYFFSSNTVYFLSAITFISGAVSFVLADVYRRAYKYYITNFRIAIIRKFLTYSELYIRYENLVDMDVYVSVAGRIFSFGDIVPITAADIGAGANMRGSFSAGSISVRATEVPRKLPSECFFGVKRPYLVRNEIAEYMQKSSASYELRQIQAELRTKAS
jgi:signal transduction histidine kinase